MSGANSARHELGIEPGSDKGANILVVSGSAFLVRHGLRQLMESRGIEITRVSDLDGLAKLGHPFEFTVALVAMTMNSNYGSGLGIVRALRQGGMTGYIVILTDDPSVGELCDVLMAGADDYVLMNFALGLAKLIERGPCHEASEDGAWSPDRLGRSAFLFSLGLSRAEVGLLVEFARDFPRGRELAERLGRSETQLRKAFSRIYEKLGATIAVETPAQLSQLLTLFSLSMLLKKQAA